MGHLGKSVLKHFVETECERRLFWDVAEREPGWMSPPREPLPPSFERRDAARRGHAYEQQLYRALCRLPGTRAERAVDGSVLPRVLEPAGLEALYAEALAAPLLLLEHEWRAPASFFAFLLGLPPGAPSPLELSERVLRPDLLALGSDPADEPWEVLPDGALRPLSAGERAARVPLRVIDIKHTSEQSVGRSHFVELLYYAHALSHWLAAHGLSERFYVPMAGHAIIPWISHEELAGLTLQDVLGEELTVPMVWLDARALFTRARERIQALVAGRPHVPDEVPVRIQSGCGMCRYLNDCKASLQRGSTDPGDWDLRLLPYTSPATAELLRDLEGLRTVRDVAQRMPLTPGRDGYDPLYAERPLLRLKARALMAGRVLPAGPEHLGGQRQFSMAIPRYSDLSLFFDLETDPTHEVVFAAALRLDISCAPGAPFREIHDAWWMTWGFLLQSEEPLGRGAAVLEGVLDPELLEARGLDGGAVRALLAEAAQALESMRQDGELEISSPAGEDRAMQLRWTWSYVSDSCSPEAELRLAQSLLLGLHACVMLCNATEALVGAVYTWNPGPDERRYPVAPSMAMFYWSAEQVAHIRELLERQVPGINNDERLRRRFRELLEWLGPAESNVAHYDQHRKIFDLRAFVETSWGLPHIISCTWHELLAQQTGLTAHPKYWARHFNYMDYSIWQAALEIGNARRRLVALDEIGRQLESKLEGLRRILIDLRRAGSEALVMKQGVETRQLCRRSVEDSIHPIGRTWFLYARLSGTVQQLEADEVRLSYPSRGIGRLKAARAASITLHPGPKGSKVCRIHFRLEGMSAGVKFREGDRVLMLPETDRASAPWDAEVTIESMRYLPAERGYACVATASASWGEHLGATLGACAEEPVYLYPTALDIWSKRLLTNKTSLLRRHGRRAGTSWLGFRASYLLRLQQAQRLEAPPERRFHLSEFYLYAPSLLPAGVLEGPLRTSAWPPPDPSQEAAIRRALGSAITCLQGPPGTGKSQTIAALLDEYLQRADGPRRILITAFSYDAMSVLLRKLEEHRDAAGQPTAAGRIPRVFARSEGRELELGEGSHELVVTGNKLILDGARLGLRGKRLEDYLPESFVLFANAHVLYHLGQPSSSKSYNYKFLHDGFGFDLIIVDEASQLPADHFLSSALLVRDGLGSIRFPEGEPDWSRAVPARQLEAMEAELPERLTQVVVVGDHHQLPPVQPVRPPARLQKVLGSLFRYLIEGHKLPAHQLGVNYRSTDAIVEYTRTLGLYGELVAFRKDSPWPALPPVPEAAGEGWLRGVLDPAREVHALIHERVGERATSELEAKLAAEAVRGFYWQLGVADAEAERAFWAEQVGVVAPHNAQGRQIIQWIKRLMEGVSCLEEEVLDRLLRATVYSVEKFQGSDRTFIIASMGISDRDQLLAEEAFIFGISRFNVLTSRAKQKMLLLCSRTFLDHIPRDREIMAQASRIRAYALDFCSSSAAVRVVNERGDEEVLDWRWREG